MTPAILCPVDFSDDSKRALRHAARVAARSRGSLTVVFVDDALLFAAAARSNDRAERARLRAELDRFVQRSLRDIELLPSPLKLEIAVGDPAREIQRIARTHRANLIVMGSHGLSGLSKLMMGSTTERVLREAKVPVLAIPPARPHRKRLKKVSGF
jgi:universal stress protein A